MPEWEKQLDQWRRQAIAALGSREIVAELEAHLRDAMDRKTQQGATPPEAWQTSLAELGPLPSLKAEFDLAASQKPWILGRCLGGLWVVGALAIVSLLQPIATVSNGPNATASIGVPLEQTRVLHFHVLSLVLAHWTVAVGWLLAIGVLCGRFLGALPWARRTDACRHLARAMMLAGGLFAAGILLGMVWSKLAWGVFWNNDPREYACLAAFLGCLSGWILGRVQVTNPMRWALLSLANGIVAAWALFGPMLWGSGLHAYGQGGSGAWSVLLVVSALGFLPMALAWIPQRRLQTRKI